MNNEKATNSMTDDAGNNRLMSRRELGKALSRTGLALAASALAAKVGLAADGAPAPLAPATTPDSMAHGMHMDHDMTDYGIPAGPPQQVAMLVYPEMTALDLIGPNQVLAGLMNINVHLVWKDRSLITTDTGIPIQPTMTFKDCPNALTVLFVPGGSRGTVALMDDPAVLDFLAHQGQTARYVTSVCTGALVLGAAGLLKGYRATSHWAFRDLLPLMGATLAPGRVVEDRSRITGGGVTAGIDFGLHLAAKLRNEKYAKAMQLGLEYDPQPPYHAGTPAGAGADITQMLRALYEPTWDGAQAAAVRARKRLS